MKLIIYILSLIDKYNQKKIVNFFKSEKIQVNTFFDVGAHKGETIKLFNDNFNIKEFYCFEPSPINFNYLKKKISKLNNNIKIFNFGLGENKSVLNFNQLEESSSSTLVEINQDSNYYKKKNKILSIFNLKKNEDKIINVKISSLNDFMEEQSINKIDILKIDTEGFEFKVIKGAREKIKDIKYIYFEHHYDDMLKKKYSFSDIHGYLIKNGFIKVFKLKMFFRKTFEYIYQNTKI